jgi:hypothetical protein
MSEIWYRIRSKRTGKFSKGGTSPSFSKHGKLWTRANLLRHLKMFAPFSGYMPHISKVYDNCELVIYELNESNIAAITSELKPEDLLQFIK